MTDKFDYVENYKECYATAKGEIETITIPASNYLTNEGTGDFTDDLYKNSCNHLRGIAYSAKLRLKRRDSKEFFEYIMPPIESVINQGKDSREVRIMQPSYITGDIIEETKQIATVKNPKMRIPGLRLIHAKQIKVLQTKIDSRDQDAIKDAIGQLIKAAKAQKIPTTNNYHLIDIKVKEQADGKLKTFTRTLIRLPLK